MIAKIGNSQIVCNNYQTKTQKSPSFKGLAHIVCDNPVEHPDFYQKCFDFWTGVATRHEEISSVKPNFENQNTFLIQCKNYYDEKLKNIAEKFSKDNDLKSIFEATPE